MKMFRFNVLKNNLCKGNFASMTKFMFSFNRRGFSTGEVLPALNQSTRSLPLGLELKVNKTEELFVSLTKKYEQAAKNKSNTNIASFVADSHEYFGGDKFLFSLDSLYSTNDETQFQIENFSSESLHPKLGEIRHSLNSILKNAKNQNINSIKESVDALFKIISENIKSSENKVALIEDSLKILNFVRNLSVNNKSLGNNYVKEAINTYLNILNSIEVSFECFKINENFLFYVIENHLKINDITDLDQKLTQSVSSSIMKTLEKFGDAIMKYSGEKNKEMFDLYFLFAYFYLNIHNQDYSKGEDYIKKAADILKQKDLSTEGRKDYLSYIKLNYVLGEIQLNRHKDLKESFVYFTEAIKSINQLNSSNTKNDQINQEIYEILKMKNSVRYSHILLIAKEKIDEIIQISDNLIEGKDKINMEIIYKHPEASKSYITYLKIISDFLSSQGYNRRSYDYLKYIYILKREIGADRSEEIDLLSFNFENSTDFYFFSQLFCNNTKLPEKEKISIEKLKELTDYFSNLLKDTLVTDLASISIRIPFANNIKNIIDDLNKYRKENGIKLENEEKFNWDHLISTIKLNTLCAEYEKAAENLNKAIELVNIKNSSEKSDKVSDLINLNTNLYLILSAVDKNNKIIPCLQNLKNIAKNNFDSNKDEASLELMIEANLDLYELYFENNKVNEGIDCLIEASELNKNFEKINSIKFKFFSNKLRKIRDNIQSFKERMEKETSEMNEEKQKYHEHEERKQNKSKSALYGIFSKN